MTSVMINNCMTALITPFKNNKVDYNSLERIIDNQIENNISLVACGTTAETATLEDEEYKAIIKFIIKKADKKSFVMAGCGTNSTKKL